ncbi:MAG: lysostaphin resistance A-like protein [Pirellulaceae bacterium]
MMKPSPRMDVFAILFTLIFPTIVTLAYFVVLAGSPPAIQQAVYGIGKVLQFGFPAVWVFVVLRKRFRWSSPKRTGLQPGFIFGLLVLIAMLALYHVLLKPSGFFDGPGDEVRAKIVSLGLNNLAAYVGTGVFYAICHSFLEEYYWRWFVFGRLRLYVPLWTAVIMSSLGFMAHHVILLATYFGWTCPATYLFSIAVAIGGAMWAWIYERSGSLYGPWLSHCLVDAAIFILGYDLAQNLFAG